MRRSTRIRAPGFTLIETLVTTLVLAVLSSVAWASYRDLLLKAHRGEARVALLQVQAAQERHFLDHLAYSATLDAATDAGGLGLATTTEGGRYALGLRLAVDGQHYLASAWPVPGSTQAADRACARLWIDETGERSGTSRECWP